jgi:hypothetical protein
MSAAHSNSGALDSAAAQRSSKNTMVHILFHGKVFVENMYHLSERRKKKEKTPTCIDEG